MPGFLVHVGAQVICSHAGQAQPTVPNPRVTVSGQPTVLMTIALPRHRLHASRPHRRQTDPVVTAQWTQRYDARDFKRASRSLS